MEKIGFIIARYYRDLSAKAPNEYLRKKYNELADRAEKKAMSNTDEKQKTSIDAVKFLES